MSDTRLTPSFAIRPLTLAVALLVACAVLAVLHPLLAVSLWMGGFAVLSTTWVLLGLRRVEAAHA